VVPTPAFNANDAVTAFCAQLAVPKNPPLPVKEVPINRTEVIVFIASILLA
jgi:hypothetical protein